MYKRIVALFFFFAFFASMIPMFCYAEMDISDMVYPQFTYIARINAAISISNDKVSFQGRGYSQRNDTSTAVTATLQYCNTGTSAWIDGESWMATASGWDYAIVSGNVSAEHGRDYRIYVTCTISDAEGVILETGSTYSQVVSYP